MEFRILGPLEVVAAGRPLPLRGTTQRALLTALLLHPSQVVPTEQLIDDLWGGSPPETAAKIVQNTVSQLRRLFETTALGNSEGRDILLTRSPGYCLSVGDDEIDALRFERLAGEGRAQLAAGDAGAAAATLRWALELWRGPALADVAYEAFAQRAIRRLDELRLTALEDRIEAELALGRHANLVGELEALTEEHPLRERLRSQLMLALYRSGRQADSLAVYQRTRQLLVDELGIEPSPMLQRLERAVLVQDRDLELDEPESAVEPAHEDTPREVRKTVCVVHAELAPKDDLHDPEARRRVLAPAVEAAARTLERHGATVERLPGGAAMVGIFGLPIAHEDDAIRAGRAALELNAAASAASAGVAARAGIGTGEIVAAVPMSAGSIAGEPLTVAARLQQATSASEIFVCAPTAQMLERVATLEAAPPIAVDGRHEPAWRLRALVEDAEPIARRLDAPLVGRGRELEQLGHALERARRDETSFLFTVLGPAGIGKSRLAREFCADARSHAIVLTGRCLSYGENITFWPLREVLRQARDEAPLAEALAEIDDAVTVVSRVDAAIGAADAASTREEIFWAVRQVLEALARRRPLLVVIEDIHWAEPTFLDLIDHLVDWSRGAPILLLCTARPELLEQRPDWSGGKLNATSILLEPLTDDESDALIANLTAARGLAEETRSRIAAAAEGNPLFLEQTLALLAQHGDGGTEVAFPPTIHLLLTARLDRLDRGERTVLERASVVGREFSREAIAELLPERPSEDLERDLLNLVRKDLLRPERSRLGAGDAFRFRHLLIREAAYESVPKALRAELHERTARRLQHEAGPRAAELEEIVGYHLEQAFEYRLEIGAVDASARAIGEDAAAQLANAGRRAAGRGDMPAAVGLLSRAAAVLPADAPSRPDLLADLAEALRDRGDFRRVDEVLDELDSLAAALGDRALAAHSLLIRLRSQLQTDPHLVTDRLVAAARGAIAVFEQSDDDRRLARAYELLAWAPWLRGRVAEAEGALERAFAHAERAGDRRTQAQSLNLLAGAALYGPLPVPEGIVRCNEILRLAGDQQRIVASALRALAGLTALAGDFDEARQLLARLRGILHDLGLVVTAASTAETFGFVELLANDAAAAERELRAGFESLEAMGETSNLSNLGAMLAQALYRLGRDEEALAFTESSEGASVRDDFSAQVQWRAARAKVLARLGNVVEADLLGREAVEMAAATDFLILRTDALMDFVEVLRRTGHVEEIPAVAQQALALAEQKQNTASIAAIRRVLDELA